MHNHYEEAVSKMDKWDNYMKYLNNEKTQILI
jgi:hypothetical protein